MQDDTGTMRQPGDHIPLTRLQSRWRVRKQEFQFGEAKVTYWVVAKIGQDYTIYEKFAAKFQDLFDNEGNGS